MLGCGKIGAVLCNAKPAAIETPVLTKLVESAIALPKKKRIQAPEFIYGKEKMQSNINSSPQINPGGFEF